jgi:hypothetical protein
MLRRTMIALFAVASVGLVSPTVASARGGGYGASGFQGGGACVPFRCAVDVQVFS